MSDHDEGYVIIERRTGNFGTFVWGLLVGAAAALLFAPKSGQETRDELAGTFDRLRDEAEGRVREAQETVSHTLDDARHQFAQGMESARRTMETGREAMRASADEVQRRVRESSEAFRSGYEAARAEASPDDTEPETEPSDA